MADSIETLLSQLTLEEKISLLAGADLWYTLPVERLGIPALKVTDGPVGARGAEGSMAPTSACFPCGTALAATWNPELIQQVGAALGEETKAKGAHILLAPTVNIHRSPLAGRNFECYSEDPYLTSRMAIAYINGVQSQGVGACIKHFACNDSEFERRSLSSEVQERPLHEIYLYPFQVAIWEAKPWAVMSAYNQVNGVHCSENDRLLLDILKGEWRFDGLVMSDWFGTYSPNVPKSGLDLEMPGPARWMGQHALEAVRSGNLSVAALDDKVRRLLRTLQKTGAFENPTPQPEQSIDRPEHRRVARQAAREAIVLLKNDRQVLPLDLTEIKTIAVIGENARWAQIMGGGSAEVTPHYKVSPLDGIRDRVGNAAQVSFAIGCPIHRLLPLLDSDWLQGGCLSVELYDNLDGSGEPAATFTTDRANITFTDHLVRHVHAHRFTARLSGALVVPETGRYDFSLQGNGQSCLLLDGEGLIGNRVEGDPWGSPEQIAHRQLTAGQPYRLDISYRWEGESPWRVLRLGCQPPQPSDPIAEAVALAARSDVAVVVVGLTFEWEGEGNDRVDMDLPGAQVELIERVAAANPRTIVVLNVGSPLHLPWLDKAPGVVLVWYTGQEQGNALAEVLFGDANPSGRLPQTWPKRLEDNPAFINYPGENGQVLYGEGLFVGYRYYDKKDVEPQFPFGYGLSYTTFDYRNLSLSAAELGPGETLTVRVDVQNTGKHPGQEVIQLYVCDVASSLARPLKELKAFQKVLLQPGETQTVTLTLDREALAFYDPARQQWIAEAGEFEAVVGGSARDIRLVGRFTWKGDAAPEGDQTPRWHIGLTLRQLMADGGARAVLGRRLGAQGSHPMIEMVLDLSLEQIAGMAPEVFTPEVLKAISADLAKL
jgi:beta-glucosidase